MSQFKIIVLGQGSVGKTSLIERYCKNIFLENKESTKPTVQASFLQKKLFVSDVPIVLNIWDTAGQEQYHSLAPMYYRKSDGALLVFDIGDTDSFEKVKEWLKELHLQISNSIPCMIVGNKYDLSWSKGFGKMNVNGEIPLIVESFINELIETKVNCKYKNVSAKTGHGVEDMMLELSKMVIENHSSGGLQNDIAGNSENNNISFTLTNRGGKSRCCF
jgi:small GTP-binding protein